VICGHVKKVCAVCCEREIFLLLHMNCCRLVYWLCFSFLKFFRAFVCFEANKYDDDDDDGYGVGWYFNMILLLMSDRVLQLQNYENRLIFGDVMGNSFLSFF